jgi:hypothetical protein
MQRRAVEKEKALKEATNNYSNSVKTIKSSGSLSGRRSKTG